MDFLSDFKQYLIEQRRSPYTVRGYLADLRQFITWFTRTQDRSFSPQEVTASVIHDYHQYLQVSKCCKAATINHQLAAISSFLVWAMKISLIASTPRVKVRYVRSEVQKLKSLNQKQQNALFRIVVNDLVNAEMGYPKRKVSRQRDASIVQFLFNTGLRLGELLKMRKSDINFGGSKATLTVRQAGGRRERQIRLNNDACQALQDWMAIHPNLEAEYLWVGCNGSDDQLSARAIQRIFHRYGRQAGIQDLTASVARHTFANNLVGKGMPFKEIARQLGFATSRSIDKYLNPKNLETY